MVETVSFVYGIFVLLERRKVNEKGYTLVLEHFRGSERKEWKTERGKSEKVERNYYRRNHKKKKERKEKKKETGPSSKGGNFIHGLC